MNKIIVLILVLFGSFEANSQVDSKYDDEYHAEFIQYKKHLFGEESLDSKAFQALEDRMLQKNSFFGSASIAETYLFDHLNRPANVDKGLDILKTSFQNGQLHKANATASYFRLGGLSTSSRVHEFNKIFQTNLKKSFGNFIALRDIVLANALGLGDEDLINESKIYYLPISPSGLSIGKDNVVTEVFENSIFLGQIQSGDKISSINGEQVNEYYDFRKVQQGLSEGQRSTISFIRNGDEKFIKFRALKKVDYYIDLLNLAWIEFKQSNYLEANQIVDEYFDHPDRVKITPDVETNTPPFDAFAKGIKCLALGYDATRTPNTIFSEIIDLCESSIHDFEKSLALYGIINPEKNPFVKIRLSEFNPNYSDAYDQVLDYLARYYLGPWANTGASTEVINLELASLNLQKSFLVAASNQDYMNNILIQLAKINQDFPIPISTYKAVNQELLQNIELLASQDNNAGDWVKQHAAQIYRHHDKFLNSDAELKMRLQLMKSDYNISSYHPERAAQIFFDKKEYKSATKYMEIALNDFDSKYAAWKLAEWYTEAQEILDLNKAYSAFRKGDELGSDYSAIRRVGMLMDHKIDVSKEEVDTVIEKNILKFNDPSYFQSANFYDHVVLGYASGYASYTEDDDLLCHYASKGIKLKSFNYISKLWNGWCVLIDERAGSKISALINLEELSDLGSSSATLFLAMYYQELEGLENLEKSLLLSRKALNQNKDKNYKALNKKYSWVAKDALFFNADISFIRNLGDETKAEIKREKSYLANIKKVKEDKEKRKLAIIREQERVRSRQRTAEVTSGFFNFLGDALLVVGAIALAAAAVDVIADADPEVLDAMANSFNSYSYDWDGFYDQYGDWTYRCRTIETGRFAENYNCSGEYKDDDRWPSDY